MLQKPKCPVIAIEEHYWDAELASHFVGIESGRPGEQQRRLDDLGDLRITEMDEAGIDVRSSPTARLRCRRSLRTWRSILPGGSMTGCIRQLPPIRRGLPDLRRCRRPIRRRPPPNLSAA